MTVATKIMMGSGAVESAYEIEQSLVFERSSSSYLHRTPSSTSNQRTFTISTWVKRAGPQNATNDYDVIFGNYKNVSQSDSTHFELVFYQDQLHVILWNTALLITNRLFRDMSAWYHIVLAVDSTSSTANNRVRLYVNGVEETSFATRNNPAQNFQFANNLSGTQQMVGNAYSGTNNMYDGQMAEFHHIDGTALTPSSFGETNSDTGQWIPKEYSGSYGTNGFYLKFVSSALGTDSSGEGNNLTAVNLENGDVVIDTPTNNFATMNPIYVSGDTNTFSEGNLKIVMASTGGGLAVATIVPTAGKYYAEFKMLAGDPSYGYIGVTPVTTNSKAPAYMTSATNSIAYYGYNGQIIAYPNDTVLSTEAYYRVNDIIAVAIDYDNSTIKWYKNNSLQYTKTSAGLTDVTFGIGDTSGGAGQTMQINFGQRAFVYTPPSGYTTLSTANLPEPAIPLPSAHFNTIAYTGDGSQDVTGVGFQPDLAWVKSRGSAYNHQWHDAVRGATAGALFSNSTTAATSYQFDSFDSDGFTTDSGNIAGINANGDPMVAWNWKANGSGSTDTSGDIDAVVSANQTAGFSIITWTGDGGAHTTVPHGLGVAPEIIFEKYLNAAGAWYTWVTAIDGTNDYLLLNTTNAAGDAGASGTPTSQFFSNWGSNKTNVAYAFVSKPGYSKIGVYTGNGSADGPFVNTGFKPAWLMYKIASTTVTNGGDWGIRDNKRDPGNVANRALYANLAAAEGSTILTFDLLSNGFKVRSSNNDNNQNGQTFLYMAFAEAPFKYANAR